MARRKLTPLAGAIASALVLATVTPASAQSAGAQTSAPNTASEGRQAAPAVRSAATAQPSAMADQRASELIGRVVRNSEGEDLGRVRDMVVDMTNKRIHYAVVSHGGVLGIGDRDTAVPVSRLQRGARDGDLVLNMTKDQLKDAPEIERNVKWNDPRTWDNVGQHYHRTLGMAASDPAAPNSAAQAAGAPSATGTWPSRTDAHLMRATDLIGMDVLDSTGTEIGEIEDLVVDFSSGNVHYAVLEFDRRWNPVDKLVALPLDAFQPTRDGKDLSIDRTREQIANAPSFDRREWPALSEFRNRVTGDRTTGMDTRRDPASSAAATTPGRSAAAGSAAPTTASPSSAGSTASTEASPSAGSVSSGTAPGAGGTAGMSSQTPSGSGTDRTSSDASTSGGAASATTPPGASGGSTSTGQDASGSAGTRMQGPASDAAATGSSASPGSSTSTGSGSTSSTPAASSQSGSAVTGSESQGNAANMDSAGALSIDAAEFARLDANGDGRLNRDEARAHPQLSAQWSSVDRNNDGYISRDELDAAASRARSTSPSAPASGMPSQGSGSGSGTGSTQPR